MGDELPVPENKYFIDNEKPIDVHVASQSENTYMFDPESPQEMARLINLDRIITRTMMGGTLVGLPALSPGSQVLDIACGPGGWVLDVAYELPDIEVCGIDISRTMIDYANARARSQQLVNASFGVMDIRQPLDFADASFDLINARFLCIVLMRDAWPALIAEYKRLLRPGGILRLTETDDFGNTSSGAWDQLTTLCIQVLQRAGYGFSFSGRTLGMSPILLKLFKEAGFGELHLRSFIADCSAETEGWADFCHNSNIAALQSKHLLTNTGLITSEQFESLYQQMLREMWSRQFFATWHITSAWGSVTL